MTTITTTTAEDFKNMIETALGHKLSTTDVAVVHATPQPSGAFTAKQVPSADFANMAQDLAKELFGRPLMASDVAVVRAEDMATPSNTAAHGNKVSVGRKMKH